MSQIQLVLSGKDAVCGDAMHAEVRFLDRNSARVVEARAFLWQHWTPKKCG